MLTETVAAETLNIRFTSQTSETILPVSKNTHPCTVCGSQQQLVGEETTKNAAVLL